MAGKIRGWILDTIWKFKVSDGTERTVFDEAGYLYQRDTKITASATTLNTAITPTSTSTLTNKTLTAPKINEDVAVTATATEINAVDVTAGTITASKALVLDSSRELAFTSASTDGGTSVEPFAVETSLTGAGGVGGRARFQLDTNVALGGWANALKGITIFGASGAVTGLGSAVCAEMTLSAGTASGNYSPLELELNLATGALTGTQTSLIYASVNGDDAGTFDDNGVVLNLQGLTIGAGHVVQASAVAGVGSTHAVKIKIGDTAYYLPIHTSPNFA